MTPISTNRNNNNNNSNIQTINKMNVDMTANI